MDLGRGALSLHLGALSYLFEPFQKFRTESSFILLYSMERLRMDPPPPPFASPCLHPSVSLLYRLQSYLMDHKDPERLVRIPDGIWRILHFLCYQMNIQRDVSRR